MATGITRYGLGQLDHSISIGALRAMDTMRRAFGVPVGFSDHTSGTAIAIAAAALGAAVVEKHVTIDRRLPGPDHSMSLEFEEFAALVAAIRSVQSALGTGIKHPVAAELKTRVCVRKSVVATRALAAGEYLSAELMAVRRPGDGLPPSMLPLLVGRQLARPVDAGALITIADLL